MFQKNILTSFLRLHIIMQTIYSPDYHRNCFVAAYIHLASVRFEHSVCH